MFIRLTSELLQRSLQRIAEDWKICQKKVLIFFLVTENLVENQEQTFDPICPMKTCN